VCCTRSQKSHAVTPSQTMIGPRVLTAMYLHAHLHKCPDHVSSAAICMAPGSYDICAATHQHFTFRAIWETACRAGKLMPGAAQLRHFCRQSAHDHDTVDGTMYDRTLPIPYPRIRLELEYQADRLHQPVKATQLISAPAQRFFFVSPLLAGAY
jgi:hypothetical protein